ncbi:LysR substrate-binding domain-containing protein [Arthrobacter sp. alpha11c]
MPSFNLVQLQYFCSVAETGSFAGASIRENVSATAIATSISQLERAMKTQLCVRRRAHGVDLTPSGRLLLDEARALLRAAEEVDLTVAGQGRDFVGPITVGCYPTFAPTLIPALIDGFAALHPRVDVDFRIAPQGGLMELLREGRIDLILVYDLNLPLDLEGVVLYETPVHIIVGARHRLAGKGSVALTELKDDPYVFFDSPPASDHALEIFKDFGITPNIRYRSEQYELTRALVARNLGYCMMIHRSRSKSSYEGLPLATLELEPAMPLERVQVAWLRRAPLTSRAAALTEFARDFVGKEQQRWFDSVRGVGGRG